MDFYRTTVAAGQRIAPNCNDTSGQSDRRNQLDTIIGLYDSSGQLVAPDDDSGSGWVSVLT